jgi:hypothetical protein
MRPDKAEGRLPRSWESGPDTADTATSPASDSQRLARDRLKAQADHLRVCAWLHQLAPLTVYYSRRRVA